MKQLLTSTTIILALTLTGCLNSHTHTEPNEHRNTPTPTSVYTPTAAPRTTTPIPPRGTPVPTPTPVALTPFCIDPFLTTACYWDNKLVAENMCLRLKSVAAFDGKGWFCLNSPPTHP